jgi:Zn-dependent metalloprotease
MRRWLLVISVIILAIITGCSGEETAKKETTKTEQTEENKESEPAATQPEEKKEASAVNTEATEQLKEYLDTNFSMTTWYPHIKGVEIKEKKATVHIDINDKEISKKISMGIWGWTNSNDNELKLDEIEFLNQEGQTVSVEKNPLK